MAKKKPEFEYNLCVACGICVQECPVSALELTLKGLDALQTLYPALDDETCIGCGICGKACPMKAISMEDISVKGKNA